MRNYSKRLFRTIYLILLASISLVVESCSMTADSTLGSNMMPEEQVMEMRHLKFKGNTIVRFNSDKDQNEEIDRGDEGKNFFETRLYRTDSLLSSNIKQGYMGMRRSDILGLRSAGFATTMLYMNSIDEENGFGYKPIFDTMHLLLTVNNYGGDTLVPIRYKVYKLEKSLAENVLKFDEKRNEDSVAYINCDLSGVYNADEPIFEFVFPNSDLQQGPSTLMIPMTPTKHTWDKLVRELMLVPEDYATNSEWDGYGNKGVEIYQDDKKWSEKFFGLYIVPESMPDGKEGAMYALDLSASGLMLQGRSRNPKDPAMIKDTVGMYYYFYDDDSEYNASVNKVERDYTNALIQEADMDSSKPRQERKTFSTCYVEGLGGPATEIYLTDDFLSELIALETTEKGEFSRLGINQCLFTIYVEGADYDWRVTQSRAEELIPLLDRSLTRLGTYLDYATLSPIIDYDYVYESSSNSEIIYNGYLDRSRGCYILNITAHVQKLFNSMRQEDGTYDVAKVDEKLRTLYIGIEATSPYSFGECALQGQDDGTNNAAPIQIDLTYTLIK